MTNNELGYYITNGDEISKKYLLNQLKTEWLGKNIIFYKEIESTQLIGMELAKVGEAHGTIIIAESQTKGKGRLGRTWHSDIGKGIWLSIIIRPDLSYLKAPLTTLYTSVMIKRALESLFNIDVKIKWPNDIYLGNRKMGGILTEIHGAKDNIDYMVIGIGLNIGRIDFPTEIKDKAISLYEKLGFSPKREDIIIKLLELFELNYREFEKIGFDSFYIEYNHSLLWKGEKVLVKNLNNYYDGYLEGIDNNGYLLIKTEKDNLIRLVSGEVEFIS